MQDQYGRTIHYLRLSVTDRCNLRCLYCMPPEGVEWLPHERMLSYEQMVDLVRHFARLGVDKIRLTGGEPLVRKGLAALVRQLREIEGIEKVSLTTNGVLLKEQLDELVAAGITGVNLSLDTLDQEEFARITRRDEFVRVMEGLEAALAVGGLTVKVNCVPMESNQEQMVPLAALARDRNLAVRFIELMPIGLGKSLVPRTEEDVFKRLESVFGQALPTEHEDSAGPSRYVTFSGFKGKIGFISAISHKFCHDCNRIRLTSTGFLKTCLQYQEGVDLKAMLDRQESEEAIFEAIKDAVYHKPASHQFESKDSRVLNGPNMNAIGG